MKFLNGWKTILGVALALAACLAKHGLSVEAIVACIKDVTGSQTVMGMGLGIAVLGVAHKIEKAKGGGP